VVWETYQDTMSAAKGRRPALERLLGDARAKKFTIVLVWKLDRFGRSLIDCLNNIRTLENSGVRFIATTQGLDTDQRNPTSRFMLHVLGAAAEFEHSLILERSQAGRLRYQQDYASGKVGKTVHSRSGRDLPPHRPKKIFDRDKVIELHRAGYSMRRIAKEMSLGLGTVADTIRRALRRSESTPVKRDGAALTGDDFRAGKRSA